MSPERLKRKMEFEQDVEREINRPDVGRGYSKDVGPRRYDLLGRAVRGFKQYRAEKE